MRNENRNKISKQIQELPEDARRFCFLIENIDEFEAQNWLTQISLVLPRIHAVMEVIDHTNNRAECFFELSDIDERFDLFCHLKQSLGDKDGYEVGEELIHNELYGSLSEDLADLYFEIKRGLDIINCGQENLTIALNLWRDGFFLYWGQHLIDAERHLYQLRVHHQI